MVSDICFQSQIQSFFPVKPTNLLFAVFFQLQLSIFGEKNKFEKLNSNASASTEEWNGLSLKSHFYTLRPSFTLYLGVISSLFIMMFNKNTEVKCDSFS